MSKHDQVVEVIEAIKTARQNILSLQLSQLVRESDLGPYKLDDETKIFVKIQDLLRFLQIDSNSTLSLTKATEINSLLNQVTTDIALLARVTLTEVQANKTTLHDNASNLLDRAINILSPFISIESSKKSLLIDTKLSNLDNKVNDYLSTMSEVDSKLSSLEDARAEVNKMLELLKQTTSEAEISKQTQYFKRSEIEHQEAAKNWLRATGVISALLVLFSVASVYFPSLVFTSPDSAYESAQLIFAKFMIFAVLAFTLALSARNYQTNRHNEVVNRHRADSLETYQALTAASSNPEARDIILNHAASAIYSLHDTGFAKSKDVASTNLTPLFAMLSRQAGPSGGGS
jgi:hypothetical protein